MRIVFASCIDDVQTTGMGVWTQRIGTEMERRGHQVTYLFQNSFWPSRGGLARHGFGVQVAGYLVRNRQRVDVAIVHEPSVLGAALLGRLGGTPVVAMSHGVENRAIDELRRPGLRELSGVDWPRWARHWVLWGWREYLGFRLARHTLCLSSADRDYLHDHVGLARRLVTFFPNGADPFTGIRDAEGQTDVLVLGTWIREKGARAVPRIWRRVRTVRPESRLLLAGTGAAAAQVLADFSEEDRSSITVVPKFEGAEGREALLLGSKILLLPSLREGSPLALLEALAAGLPAVAAAVGGVPDILTHDREGYLYPPFDLERAATLVLHLLNASGERARMSTAGRTRAAQLPWSRAGDFVEAAFVAAARRS